MRHDGFEFREEFLVDGRVGSDVVGCYAEEMGAVGSFD